MKVGQLIRMLNCLDNEKQIFISSDTEGNSFNNISTIEDNESFYIIWPDDSYLEYEDLK